MQDHYKTTYEFGDILELALVKSVDIFDILQARGTVLVDLCSGYILDVESKVGERIISLSIYIVLE